MDYNYVGLVVGYFVYYYLYAGNCEYYLSGIWAYQPRGLSGGGIPVSIWRAW
ncbi:MAG: hypothetical protein ACUVRV_05540 [Cyanobacteriota bacterium]